jgi:hypothetical protein
VARICPSADIAPSGLARDERGRPLERGAAGAAHVDLVARECFTREKPALDIAQHFLPLEGRLEIEQAEPGRASRRTFDALRVMDPAPEHLHAAAQGEHTPAVAQMTPDRRGPALALEKG